MNALGITVALLISGVSADTCTDADECSMLQVDVTDHASYSVGARLRNLGEQLSALEMPDKIHRVAIDTLMKGVANQDPDSLSDTDRGNLQTVVDTLLGLKPVFLAETSQMEAEFNTTIAMGNACNQAGLTEEATAKSAYEHDQQLHIDCRVLQKTYESTAEDACGTLINVWEQSGSTCGWLDQLPLFEPGEAADHYERAVEWATGLGKLAAHYAGKLALYQEKRPLCEDARDLAVSQKGTCNGHENEYYTDYCAFAEGRNTRCNTLDTCHAGAKASYDNLQDTVGDTNNNRWKILSTLDYLVCEILALKDNTAMNQCTRKDFGDYTQYKATVYAFPAKDGCAIIDFHATVNDYVGAADWANLIQDKSNFSCNE